MKTKHLLPILISFLSTFFVSGQQLYSTQQGDIAFSITDHDSIRLLVSNDLLLILDYETSKINLRVGYETFHSQIDSIDAKLRNMKGSYLEFSGKLGITINTKNFNPQKYNMEGTLTSATPPVMIRGNGSMTCMNAGDRLTPACILLVTLESSLSSLHLDQLFSGANDAVRIDVRQSILKKEGD